MNLQNGYKVIYEEIVDGKRTFFADKLDGSAADKLNTKPFTVGEYKLVFEKDGGIFGSKSGRVEDGERIKAFDKVFCAHVDEDEDNVCDVCEEEMPAKAYTRRTRKNEVPEEPASEEPVVEETPAEAEPAVEEPEAEEPVVVEE